MSLSPNTPTSNEPAVDPAVTQAAQTALDRYVSIDGFWSFLRMLPVMVWEITRMPPATRTELKRLIAEYEVEQQFVIVTARRIVAEARSATPQNPDDVERVISSWPEIERPTMVPLHTALNAAIAKLAEVADSLRESAEAIRAEHRDGR